MTYELNEHLSDVIFENDKLRKKLQEAEAEIGSLKSELLAVNERLDDANNEIFRLSMVLKHRAKDLEAVCRPGKQYDWSGFGSRQH